MSKYTATAKENSEALGLKLIEVLGLKVKKNGRVDTSWGDKTPVGLALTVESIVEESVGDWRKLIK